MKRLNPTEDENKAAFQNFFAQIKEIQQERRRAATEAKEPLSRLVEAMLGKSGQSFHLRSLLYSLWNGGKPTDLSNILLLDWTLRKDLLAVLLAFGWSDKNEPSCNFFYNEITKALKAANILEWFVAEGEDR